MAKAQEHGIGVGWVIPGKFRAVYAIQALRSDPGERYCVSCWAAAATVRPDRLEQLRAFAQSFIDSEDPKAEESGACSQCGRVGLVVSARERRMRVMPGACNTIANCACGAQLSVTATTTKRIESSAHVRCPECRRSVRVTMPAVIDEKSLVVIALPR